MYDRQTALVQRVWPGNAIFTIASGSGDGCHHRYWARPGIGSGGSDDCSLTGDASGLLAFARRCRAMKPPVCRPIESIWSMAGAPKERRRPVATALHLPVVSMNGGSMSLDVVARPGHALRRGNSNRPPAMRFVAPSGPRSIGIGFSIGRSLEFDVKAARDV